MPRGRLIAAIAVGFAASASVAQQEFYVATTGDDANPGTLALPWRTIQHAAETLPPNSVVLVRGGVYNERVTLGVSGTGPDERIEFRAYAGESPVIDGTGLGVPDEPNGLILIVDHDWITLDGFELRQYSTATRWRVPVGIHVTGHASHITIRNTTVHHIETNYQGQDGGDAHGIAFYGNDPTDPIDSITIEGCELRDLKLGSSEALVFNGNVTNFIARDNRIHDCNNIAIDAIGFEGTSPYESTDQARAGLIERNLIWNIDSFGNPAYGNDRSAGGIYVDGGRDVIIDRNTVHHANIGIEIASEHAGKATSGITVTSNTVHHCHYTGIAIGGYDEQRGRTEDCVIANNTLYHNDTDETSTGELLVQFDPRRVVIRNNILAAGPQNLLLSNPFSQMLDVVLDDNCFSAPGGPDNAEFLWRDTPYTGWDAYRAGTGNDPASRFADPHFVTEGGSPDLHLREASPCRDGGAADAVPATSVFDTDGEPRVQGVRVDQGSDEFTDPDCTADFNGDGEVNTIDVLAFLNAWAAGDPTADCDGSGSINTIDVLCFLNVWNAGC